MIAELAALRVVLDGMVENREDFRVFTRHDMAFHQELARATGNPIFHVFMASITDLLCEFQMMYPDKTQYREASMFHHRTCKKTLLQKRTS